MAKDCRDRAAEAAVEGIRALEVFCTDRQMTENERTRRIFIGLNALQRIARLLESVGAPTRP